MTKLSSYFFSFLFVSACSNSNADKKAVVYNSDTVSMLKNDTVPIAKKIANNSLKLDNIDKENPNNLTVDEDYIQKATVSKSDSSIWLTANMKLDHRIFGYDKPDTTSRKMILISIFTNDVEGNPFKCPFGSYYQTSDMTDMEIKYVCKDGKFIKANVFKNSVLQGTVYIDKKWIEFEE